MATPAAATARSCGNGDDATAAAVGIHAYLHARATSVTGALKQHPSDFVVHEISAANDVVTLNADDKDAYRVPTTAERTAVLQAKLAAHNSKRAQRNEKLVFDEPAHGWRDALRETIGDARARDVEAVATEALDECLLDAPSEFRDRVFVQVCVQNCFPGLDCKLRKPEDGASSDAVTQIHVALDPMYKKFRAGGMSATNCARLLDYLRKGAGDAHAAQGVALVHDDSKDARTALHRLISKHSACFKTKTETRNGVQTLVALFSDRSMKKRKRSEPEVYLQCVLEKTNTEHFACFDKLARDLKRPLSAFTYAGTKDKVAVTYQHVVVQGVEPAALLALNASARTSSSSSNDTEHAASSIRIGHLQYVSEPLALGSANGNRFTIVLRDVASASSDVESAVASGVAAVTSKGFVNYFGFQRVGHPSHRVRPHHIGQAMLARDWTTVVTLLLTPSERETEAIRAAKQAFLDTGDADAALKALPGHLTLERAVLQGLKRYGRDAYDRAVESIAFSRRLMYMHAYQSFVFNVLASLRVETSGTAAIAGDLVRDADSDAVVVLTAEQAERLNAESANPLARVLLPLAGPNAQVPANAIGAKYTELLEAHGTKAALTATAGPVKGSYRALVAVPADVEWSFEADQQLLRTSFSLPSGAFATMCLREMLQTDL